MIPYGKQWIDDSDIQAVIDVLKSPWLTQGPKVNEFEKALAEYCGAKYAVAVNNGTSALHLASLAMGVKEGDEVITSPITFVATANCVIYCGGKPVFADIDKNTYNLDPTEIKKKLTPKTKAIIPVHFAGLPCNMVRINKIAKENNLLILEDACHALGAKWKDENGKWQKVGSCSHSDLTVFSFHPVKHITTGEGGAILTNNIEFYEKLILLRSHGITKDPEKLLNKNVGPWYYEMQDLGYNYRITDIQCALGLSQLRKIDDFVRRRREIAGMYDELFSGHELIKIPRETEGEKSSFHLYVVLLEFEKCGKSREHVMNILRDKGIGTQVHYIPVHLQPYYRSKFNYNENDYPVSENYYKHTISLPLYPELKDNDIETVVKSARDCLNG